MRSPKKDRPGCPKKFSVGKRGGTYYVNANKNKVYCSPSKSPGRKVKKSPKRARPKASPGSKTPRRSPPPLTSRPPSSKSKKTPSPLDMQLLPEARKLLKQAKKMDTLHDKEAPSSAHLNLGDVRAIGAGKKQMWVIAPASYDDFFVLTEEDDIFQDRDNDDDHQVGYFLTYDEPVSSEAIVVTGGSQQWWKLNRHLINHLKSLVQK